MWITTGYARVVRAGTGGNVSMYTHGMETPADGGDDTHPVGRMHNDTKQAYTVDVGTSGSVGLCVASPRSEDVSRGISVGDTSVGPVSIPRTDSTDYTGVMEPGVALSPGGQGYQMPVVERVSDEHGCNLDWLDATETDHGSVPRAIDTDDVVLNPIRMWRDQTVVREDGR